MSRLGSKKKMFLMNMGSVDNNYTLIPDANFEQALVDLGYDTLPLDGKVLTSNISSVTSLAVASKSISDLTGIEDFVSLTALNCLSNNLTSLNVSNNVELTALNCSSNSLTSLDVSNNVELTALNCSSNSLTSLDVSNNVDLNRISLNNAGSIGALDLSNTVITTIYINELRGAGLTSLILPNTLTTIGNYAIYDNSLTSIYIPDSVTSIGIYAFRFNNLTAVELPTVCTYEPSSFDAGVTITRR